MKRFDLKQAGALFVVVAAVGAGVVAHADETEDSAYIDVNANITSDITITNGPFTLGCGTVTPSDEGNNCPDRATTGTAAVDFDHNGFDEVTFTVDATVTLYHETEALDTITVALGVYAGSDCTGPIAGNHTVDTDGSSTVYLCTDTVSGIEPSDDAGAYSTADSTHEILIEGV